jgi:tetratricopeptide (TPR) repeat protein
MSVADCGDWPPVRVLGSSARFASCQECHGSQIEQIKGSKPNETRFKSLTINCESCHGPARRHVEAVRTPGAPAVAMPALATFTRDSSVAICLSCHAIKSDVKRGFLPGRGLEQHYSLAFPLLDGDETHADGRTKTFAYQQGHLYSDCYLSGSMTCVDCHEPHGQQYRDVQGRMLRGRFDDAQCTSCHPAKAQEPQLHTRHAVNSAGSRCVSCHMPFAQAAIGKELRYTRSDHTIPIPRADVDARLGVVNACRTCHQDKSTEQLQQDTRRLWGELKPLRPIVAQLIESKSTADIEAILLKRDTTHRLAYFDALARYFAQLQPDASASSRRVRSLLWQLAQSRDDDVAALALATLHLDSGREPVTRTRLIEHVRALGARDLRVRRRWVVALGHRGDALREESRRPEAITVYEKALELQPNDGAFLLALGLARLDSGDGLGASTTLRRALDVDPENSLAWLNYGRAQAATGDEAAARESYRRATQVNPYDPVAFFNLGNAMLRAGSQDSAASAYRKAIELDVSLAPAHFNLARALLMNDQKAEALAAIRTGLIFQPNHAEARGAAEQLEAELGSRTR